MLSLCLALSGMTPSTMRAVRKTGLAGCGPPSFGCVVVSGSTPVPVAGHREVLINVSSSGVNPDELTVLSLPAVHYTLGIDVAGVVAALGPGCTRLKVGDMVWAAGIKGGMAEFAVRPEATVGVVPAGVDMVAAGTLPTVAMTSFGALRSAGAPWTPSLSRSRHRGGDRELTVLVTAGTGGTGYTAVQLAKAQGATRVITAATGTGIAFAKSIGADVVVDYTKGSVYDAAPNGSVDVVISNHKSNSTAERAMAKLRNPGGIYVTLDGDTTSEVPVGITQIDYDLFDPKEAARFVEYLDAIGSLIAEGAVRTEVQQVYGFDQVKAALNVEAKGGVLSKLAVVPLQL